MPGIIDILNSDLGKTLVSGVADETNHSQGKIHEVLVMALPVLMSAMKRNAASPEGAQSLLTAINDKHDGSMLANLEGFFKGGVKSDTVNDGNKILDHILGNKKNNVEKAIGIKSGLDTSSVAKILKVAAPILMGLLGNQAQQKAVSSPSGLEGLLGSLLGDNSENSQQSFIESILDADGDGSIMDDVAGMVLGGNKKKGGLMGGLFGDKK